MGVGINAEHTTQLKAALAPAPLQIEPPGLALISMATLGKAEQTKRILKAIANPHTTILGHVTGRQLLRRPGYEVDMETILKACAKQGSRRRTPSP
jgi:histidinol phosphatase-like PHP family hydrolase